MQLLFRFCLLVFSVLPVRFAHAAAGDADPTFGNGAGYVTYATPYDAPWLITGGIALADGSSILAGHAEFQVYVRHYYRDGTLDTGFGIAGTATLSDFSWVIGPVAEFGPTVHVFAGANGTILIEQSGMVRRLSASGQYDPTYRPQLNLLGASAYPTLLPQPDGRIIVVTGQQAATPTQQISVRYYLANGSPDTVRGDVNGERLVYPAGPGVYVPTGAATQSDGKLLIAATLTRSRLDTDLALIRLNSDGSYDEGFGQNSLVTVAATVGTVGPPSVTEGSNGQIAYIFGVHNTSEDYFVVYILHADGTVDTSAAGAGRFSVTLSASPIGSVDRGGFVSPPPKLAVHLPGMLWQYDLSLAGPVPLPRYTKAGLGANFTEVSSAFGGDTLWVFGGEDRFTYFQQGHFSLQTYARGVAVPYDAPRFGTATPPRISATFPSTYQETFDELQLQPDGGMLLLGSSTKLVTHSPVLTKFKPDGTVDTGYAAGAGRALVPADTTGKGTVRLLKASDGSATLLTSLYACQGTTGVCAKTGSLIRYLPSGALDPAFGNAGAVTLPSYGDAASTGFYDDYFPGFVDEGGAATLVTASATATPTPQLQPFRYGRDGAPAAGFNGVVQYASLGDSGSPVAARIARLPDGQLQAVAAFNGNKRMVLNTFRWLADGAVDPALPTPATAVLPAADSASYATDLDAVVLQDGSMVVAIWEASQRILLRLDASGRQDLNFGNAGTARIDGVVGVPGFDFTRRRLRLAMQADGKILLAYSMPLNGGTALAVARFTVDGQPDNTFTTDGQFQSIFSVTGDESASDFVRLADGKLMVAGVSDGRGLFLRLKGETAVPVQAQSVVEFFNTGLGHYFITANPAEAAGIDQGSAGPGWQRTGKGFLAWTPAGGLPDASLPVCRFYGTPGRGPNSHFYTVNANECAGVKNDPGWTYEGIAFYAFAPASEKCVGALQPIYRAYNNRYAQNDSNHRYASDVSVLQPLVTQGWTIEGAVFCVPRN